MIRLRGITWDHPRGYAPLEAAARLLREEGSVDICWTRRSLQSFADQPLAALAERYDLLVIDHPHLGEAIAADTILPLDDPARAAALADLKKAGVGPSHASYTLSGRQWALAIDAAAQVSAWRPDLLIEPPSDWEGVIRLAEQGGVLFPLKPVDAIDSAMTLAANLGDPIGLCADRAFARDTGRRVLDALAAVARHVPAACLDQDPIAVLDALSGSDAHRYCPLLFGYTNYARAGFRDHTLRFGDLPPLGGNGPVGSILGGAGIAVSAHAAHREVAMEVAYRLASPAIQAGVYVGVGGQPAHRAAWEDPEADALCGGFFSGTARTMAASWIRPRHDGFLAFAEEGGNVVNAFLKGDIERETALDRLDACYVGSLGGRMAA